MFLLKISILSLDDGLFFQKEYEYHTSNWDERGYYAHLHFAKGH